MSTPYSKVRDNSHDIQIFLWWIIAIIAYCTICGTIADQILDEKPGSAEQYLHPSIGYFLFNMLLLGLLKIVFVILSLPALIVVNSISTSILLWIGGACLAVIAILEGIKQHTVGVEERQHREEEEVRRRKSEQERMERERVRREEEDKRRQIEEAERIKQERKRQEKDEIDRLTAEVIHIIEDARSHADETILTSLILLNAEVSELANQFHSGQISHTDAKSKLLQYRQEAETLSTRPIKDEESIANAETYYSFLEVPVDAPVEIIKRAIRKKYSEYHPDRVYGPWNAKGQQVPDWIKQEVEEKSRKLGEINAILTDPLKRREYDKKIGVT